MKYLIVILLLFSEVNLLSQNNNSGQDTVQLYLIEKCFELFQPHSDLTYSFGSEELINKKPDFSIQISNLKDSAKYLEELKGDYSDWMIFYKIGNLYQRNNRLLGAMNYFNQAYNLIYNEILKDTLNAKPYSDMGSLYLNLGSNENAFYFYKKAYSLNPKDSAARMYLPMFYIFSGEYKTGEELIEKKLTEEPENIEMHIWLLTSMIYQKMNAFNKNDSVFKDKPIDQLFDFSRLNASSKKYKDDIRFGLLEQMGKQMALLAKYSMLYGNFLNAEISEADRSEVKLIQNYLEKVLSKKQFKNEYILYKSLGFNFLLQKKVDKAIEYFNQCIGLWPAEKNSKDYYILFTTQYFIKNDTLAAIKVIRDKLRNDSTIAAPNLQDYILLGNVFLTAQDYNYARIAYSDALNIQETPDAYLGLSVIEIKKLKLAEANQLINKAYDLNKEYFLTYALFGMITLMNNQKDAAKDALNKARQLKPDEQVLFEVYSVFFPE